MSRQPDCSPDNQSHCLNIQKVRKTDHIYNQTKWLCRQPDRLLDTYIECLENRINCLDMQIGWSDWSHNIAIRSDTFFNFYFSKSNGSKLMKFFHYGSRRFYLYKKQKIFKMTLICTHTLAKSPGTVVDGFINCFQWYLLHDFNTTRLQSGFFTLVS